LAIVPAPSGYWGARLLERREAERALRDDFADLQEDLRRQTVDIAALRHALDALGRGSAPGPVDVGPAPAPAVPALVLGLASGETRATECAERDRLAALEGRASALVVEVERLGGALAHEAAARGQAERARRHDLDRFDGRIAAAIDGARLESALDAMRRDLERVVQSESARIHGDAVAGLREQIRGDLGAWREALDEMRGHVARQATEIAVLRDTLVDERQERGVAIAGFDHAHADLDRRLAVQEQRLAAQERRLAAHQPEWFETARANDERARREHGELASRVERITDALARETTERKRLEAAFVAIEERYARQMPAAAAPPPRRDPEGASAAIEAPAGRRRERAARRRGIGSEIRRAVRIAIDRIAGSAGLALETDLQPAQRRYLATVEAAADGALGVLRRGPHDPAAAAAPVTLRMFDLWQSIECVVEPLGARARRKGVKLSVHVAHAVPARVGGDPTALEHVVANILENAIEHTDAGEVSLSIRETARTEESVVLLFATTDSGCGIPPARQAALFDGLGSPHALGVRGLALDGIGLLVAADLVRALGGHLWLESEPGQGTSVRFAIPFRLAVDDSGMVLGAPFDDDADRTPVWDAAGGVPLRVLVADGDPIARAETAAMLERLGHVVVTVEDGERVLARMALDRFDAVVMASRMPRLDAFEAAASIRARAHDGAPREPLVVLMDRLGPGDRERVAAVGIDAAVVRPLRRAELERVLRRAVAVIAATPSGRS
jgi:signal transduction histidine kinase